MSDHDGVEQVITMAWRAQGAINMKNPYLNDLNEDVLLVAYARSYVWVLSGKGLVTAANAPELAQTLFGPAFPHAEAAVRKAIAELPLSRGMSTGTSVPHNPMEEPVVEDPGASPEVVDRLGH